MKNFRADLHIHSTLSPCGDLDMHPAGIVSEAVKKELDIIGMTDHNTTRHCALISKLASEKGIYVLKGAEVTTKEEVHCLAFFDKTDELSEFQDFLDRSLPDIRNNPEIFGYQVQCDEDENIVFEEPRLLLSAIVKSIEEVGAVVRSLGGLFIPAHADRQRYSILSQLGFIPVDLEADALEISATANPVEFVKAAPGSSRFPLIKSSDAHILENIGLAVTIFRMEGPSFCEIRMALKGEGGRRVTAG